MTSSSMTSQVVKILIEKSIHDHMNTADIPLSTSAAFCLHSDAAGGTQRGDNRCNEACKNLQECHPTIFLHSRFNFKVST